MQRTDSRPSLGLDTRALLTLIKQVEQVSLPHPTLTRWLLKGLVVPSLFQSRTRGRSHRWSAGDAVLLAGLARIRSQGIEIQRYRGELRRTWGRLTAALAGPPPRYLVAMSDTLTVLDQAGVADRLGQESRAALVVWPALPLERVRREAALLGVSDLP